MWRKSTRARSTRRRSAPGESAISTSSAGDGGELGRPPEGAGEGPEVLEGLLEAEGHLGRVVEDEVERGGRGPVVHGHGGPGRQGQEGADHDGGLQLQLGAHEDGPGPQVGAHRALHHRRPPGRALRARPPPCARPAGWTRCRPPRRSLSSGGPRTPGTPPAPGAGAGGSRRRSRPPSPAGPAAAGQANTASTPMAERTTTATGSSPHEATSTISTKAHEKLVSDEMTSPAGWSMCQR